MQSTSWQKLDHKGNTGFGGDILIINNTQGRVYPLSPYLWRWEIRSLANRHIKAAGTALTKELAQKEAEKHFHKG